MGGAACLKAFGLVNGHLISAMNGILLKMALLRGSTGQEVEMGDVPWGWGVDIKPLFTAYIQQGMLLFIG